MDHYTDQGALNVLRMFLDSLLAKDPTTYPAGLGDANDALATLARHHVDRRTLTAWRNRSNRSTGLGQPVLMSQSKSNTA